MEKSCFHGRFNAQHRSIYISGISRERSDKDGEKRKLWELLCGIKHQPLTLVNEIGSIGDCCSTIYKSPPCVLYEIRFDLARQAEGLHLRAFSSHVRSFTRAQLMRHDVRSILSLYVGQINSMKLKNSLIIIEFPEILSLSLSLFLRSSYSLSHFLKKICSVAETVVTPGNMLHKINEYLKREWNDIFLAQKSLILQTVNEFLRRDI